MKKIIALILAISVLCGTLLSITSCSIIDSFISDGNVTNPDNNIQVTITQ